MPLALEAIQVKVNRAKEHLDVLNAEIDRFCTDKPYPLHVVTYKGSHEVHDVVWLRLPPARWGAIVGDCVHNLRCALDHVVWTLSGGTSAPRHSEFPIFEDEGKYFKRTNKYEPAPGSGLRKIDAVEPFDARIAIRSLQPFKAADPARHPLWVLHELDNFDKHRALHVVTGWAYPGRSLARRGIRDVSDLEPGWRKVRATYSPEYPTPTPAGSKAYVKVRGDLAIRIALEGGPTRPDENIDVVLAGLVDFVETKVVPALTPYLPFD